MGQAHTSHYPSEPQSPPLQNGQGFWAIWGGSGPRESCLGRGGRRTEEPWGKPTPLTTPLNRSLPLCKMGKDSGPFGVGQDPERAV